MSAETEATLGEETRLPSFPKLAARVPFSPSPRYLHPLPARRAGRLRIPLPAGLAGLRSAKTINFARNGSPAAKPTFRAPGSVEGEPVPSRQCSAIRSLDFRIG